VSHQDQGIQRKDDPRRRTHGWLVFVRRKGKIHTRLFSDGVHGGRESALERARNYRDRYTQVYSGFTRAEHCAIRRSNNSSGIAGVCRSKTTYYNSLRNRYVTEEHWIARIPTELGKVRYRKFSVARHGENGARILAVEARRDALARLGMADPSTATPRHVH